jgi:hypothetical protein
MDQKLHCCWLEGAPCTNEATWEIHFDEDYDFTHSCEEHLLFFLDPCSTNTLTFLGPLPGQS